MNDKSEDRDSDEIYVAIFFIFIMKSYSQGTRKN